ncbi:MAG: hypothetical protein QNJ70_15420 [Xenococcaceae cyanobacterium MO_207.B15]|nr:hypothetical protein [Xenococcaceae cyanobacterium MO_207.B15]
MKFLLLKALLLRRAKDEGFTLPIVIAIGLVMLLLSTVNLIQSGEETVLSISKQSSSNALASAEFGIARYRELLNNNRVLAVYNLDQWTAAEVEACDVITNTGGGWADSASNTWRDVSLNETTFSVDFNDDGDQNDTNVVIGEYKIVDYEYDNDGIDSNNNNRDINLISDAINNDGTPPRGILTVQGRAPDGSEAQIQVEIPLGVNTDDLNSLDPGLWIEQSTINNIGTVNVNGSNIVLYRPAGSGGCDDPPDLSSQNTISDPRLLPDIIAIPNSRTIAGDITNVTDPVLIDPNTNDHIEYPRDHYLQDRDGDGVSEILLGTKFDDDNTNGTQALYTGADGEERYYYSTGNLNLAIDANESILADGLGKVILHVGGDLVIDTGNAGDEVYLANSSNNATSQYLEIHVEGNVTITGSGALEIRGLLHVPNGTVSISNSADVNVVGSIWANDWDNQSSGTVTITTDDYEYYSITPNRTPKPLTYRPSNWQTQEVD